MKTDMGFGRPSEAQRELLERVLRSKSCITLYYSRFVVAPSPHSARPIGWAAKRYPFNSSTMHACLNKGLLVGTFDKNYRPSWTVHPDMTELILRTWKAEEALGVVDKKGKTVR